MVYIWIFIRLTGCTSPEKHKNDSFNHKIQEDSTLLNSDINYWQIHTSGPEKSRVTRYPSLKEVFNAIRQFNNWGNPINLDTSGAIRFAGFDFNNFLPVQGTINSNDFYMVNFDSSNQTSAIHHIVDGRVSNFSIAVHLEPLFSLYRISLFRFSFGQHGISRAGGTFVYLPALRLNLYFDTQDLMGVAQDSLTYLQAIDVLDSNLIPRKRLIISQQMVEYIAMPNYESNNTLSREVIYIPSHSENENILCPPTLLTDEMSLESLKPYLSFEPSPCFRRIGRLKPNKHFSLPRWVFQGSITYE